MINGDLGNEFSEGISNTTLDSSANSYRTCPNQPEVQKNKGLTDIVAQRQEVNPNASVVELMDISTDEIQTLSPRDYAKYLDTINHIGTPEEGCQLIFKNFDILLDRFEEEIRVIDTLPLEQSKIRRRVSNEIGGQTVSLFHRLASFNGIRVQPHILDRLYQHIHSDNRLLRYYACQVSNFLDSYSHFL